jgi:hypothetical protein
MPFGQVGRVLYSLELHRLRCRARTLAEVALWAPERKIPSASKLRYWNRAQVWRVERLAWKHSRTKARR